MMDVSGFWIGQYMYSEISAFAVTFQADMTQLGEKVSGDITEQNTFDDQAGQILIADLFGQVNAANITFTKTYTNSRAGLDKIFYNGTISNDGHAISGTWSIASLWTGRFKMTKAIEQKPAPKAIRIKEKENV